MTLLVFQVKHGDQGQKLKYALQPPAAAGTGTKILFPVCVYYQG